MKWKTQTGKIMDIRDMDDNHLLNSIAYVRRRVDIYRDGMLYQACMAEGCLQGEMAQDSMAREQNRYMSASNQEILTEMGYYKLLAEKRRRSL
jgi:hypothetical protein